MRNTHGHNPAPAPPSPPRKRRRPGRRNRRRAPKRLLTSWGEGEARRRLLSLRRELAASSDRTRQLVANGRDGPHLDEDALRQRAVELAAELSRTEWLLEEDHRRGVATGPAITPDSEVELVDAATGEPATYRIAAGAGESHADTVAVGSTIGQALLGRSAGSMVTIATPEGLRRVRVVSVEPLSS